VVAGQTPLTDPVLTKKFWFAIAEPPPGNPETGATLVGSASELAEWVQKGYSVNLVDGPYRTRRAAERAHDVWWEG
jgi:hypothetical protein